MLEPRGNLQPLAAEDLLAVHGGVELTPVSADPLTACECHAPVACNNGDLIQNSEAPPNKLDFWSELPL